MCGIAGFVGRGSEKDVQAMTNTISYRGPDAAGYFFEGNVGLGHRRLAIIDISSRGHQPMWDAQMEVGIVFNGEIYNFRAIRKELQQCGVQFVSESDTEVMIYAYRQWGTACFAKFEGMFAAAFYDRRCDTVVLVRDRFGEKPLYIGQWDEVIAFGSEIKAIIAHPTAQQVLDFAGIYHFLQFDTIPYDGSIYKNIKKLLPGHYVEIVRGVLGNSVPYSVLSSCELHDISVFEATTRLDVLLQQSVSARLVADVPLGIFLSGGLDSSTVAYYAQQASSQPIQTFSIGFREAEYDESSYARKVAHHIGSIHHEEIVTAESALASAHTLYSVLDEPCADPSIIPTYLLSQMTRKQVTVALGGDGSDELFLGYQTFIAHKYTHYLPHLPPSVYVSLQKYLEHVSVGSGYFSAGFKAQRLIRGLGKDVFAGDVAWRGSWSQEQLAQLCTPEFMAHISSDEIDKPIIDIRKQIPSDLPILQQLSLWYVAQYLPDDILVKVDRASMLHGLEVRAPFLDSALASFAMSLPVKYKLRGTDEKWILKKVMRGKLPQEIIDRPKKGFAIPVADWLRNELKDECERVFSVSNIVRGGFFNPTYVQRMWHAHREGTRDFRKELWALLVFLWWHETHIR